ncbi:MAG: urea transporter [Marinobacter sp.]|uniref:urea transporter n=1 Tax=Marinobacter sp. TaxID=50741 RepID=UPI003F9E44E6
MRAFLVILGRGVGQVMLQENAFSGCLMLLGIACNSWLMALAALLGGSVSTLAAMLLKFDKQALQRGWYGFNGTLVGIATVVFLQVSVWSVVLLVAGAILSTLVMRLFLMQRHFPAYTAPFVLVTWLLLLVCHLMIATNLLPPVVDLVSTSPDIFAAFWRSLGQIMFQPSPVAGLLFFAAVLVHSRVNSFYMLLGAGLPLLLLMANEMNYANFNAGLYAYNAVLCAIALGERTRASLCGAILAITLSVALQWLGIQAGLITLTAPFVLAAWVTLVLRQWVNVGSL